MRFLVSYILSMLMCHLIICQSSLDKELLTLINSNEIHPSTLSVSVFNTSDQKKLTSIRGEEFMIPASTLKLVTTFSCLDIKGGDFKYKTVLGYTGYIERDGTLKGDVWFIGSGDPTFGSEREGFDSSMEEVLSMAYLSIQQKGIKCIDGVINVDASIFDDEGAHPGWSWSDVGNYYGAGIYGLNISENEYKVTFNRDMAIGEITTIHSIHPPIPGLTVRNEVILERAGTGDNAYIYGGPGTYDKVIRGTIPAGRGTFSIRGSIPDPPYFFGYSLYKSLSAKGISSQGFEVIKTDLPEAINSLHVFESKPLNKLVKITNEKSINLYCEAFLRTISDDGTRKQGVRNIYSNLKENNLDTSAIIMTDGSGLNARNVLTSDLMTSVLNHYYLKWGKKTLNFLPRASYEGTVRGLLRHKSSKGNAWLKSGYIGGVLSYAGYVKNMEGKIFSISIIFNNYRGPTSNVREICEQIIETIYRHKTINSK